jgi:D-amino-acid oxidase
MIDTKADVLIIDAGVSGLTTALALLEAGLSALSVVLMADTPPALTTSCSAGAIWSPHLPLLRPGHRGVGPAPLRRLQELAAEPGTGVHLVTGVEASRIGTKPPAWAREVEDFQPCAPDELPTGFVSGWRYTVPVVDMPSYLVYLQARLERAGIQVESGRFAALDEAAAMASVVVNCAGLGARWLAPDDTVRPARGQIVVAENPGIEEFFAEHTDEVCNPTYMLPQGERIVLGGSIEEDEFDRVVDPKIADGILERCAEMEPALYGVTVVEHRVGLRPARPRVRVERDDTHAVPVVHNYGHGGSGVSLSWGCARAVARMVSAT